MQLIRDFIRERVNLESCGFTTPCWIWSKLTRDGYGRASLAGRTLQAHRVSYEAYVGPIPDGHEIDHLCCIAACVNPDHLEPVAGSENLRRKIVRRGLTLGGKRHIRKAPRTICPAGHTYGPDEAQGVRRGHRCQVCYRARKLRELSRDRETGRRKAATRKTRGEEAATGSGQALDVRTHRERGK